MFVLSSQNCLHEGVRRSRSRSLFFQWIFQRRISWQWIQNAIISSTQIRVKMSSSSRAKSNLHLFDSEHIRWLTTLKWNGSVGTFPSPSPHSTPPPPISNNIDVSRVTDVVTRSRVLSFNSDVVWFDTWPYLSCQSLPLVLNRKCTYLHFVAANGVHVGEHQRMNSLI